MNWQVPRIWEDGDVWIIGGGPSINKQFQVPDEVVHSVLSGESPMSAISPYLSALHDKHVIGINVAYQLGSWVDMVFFGDPGFLLKYQEGLSKFPGIKISCSPNSSKVPWIKYLPRERKKSRGISSNSGMVSWNGNSGAAAISVAAWAGARRIILLGFDMKLGENNYQHFHDAYHRGICRENDVKRRRKLPFSRHLVGFSYINKDARRMGVEIINANPDSAIQDFPKRSVKELLQ